MTEFERITPDGTPLHLAVSALIKALRRGQEVQALYWALQITERFPKYLWRRLCTFAAEDVSIANPHAIVLVNACAQASERHRTESGSRKPDRQAIAFAVMSLARSAKSRESDNLLNALSHMVAESGWRPEVPPEALDLHTPEGRERLPRGEWLRHWLEEGSQVEGEAGPLDWKLWIRRWAARRGRLDPAQVEAEAREWQRAGRLRFGPDGYGSSDVVWEMCPECGQEFATDWADGLAACPACGTLYDRAEMDAAMRRETGEDDL